MAETQEIFQFLNPTVSLDTLLGYFSLIVAVYYSMRQVRQDQIAERRARQEAAQEAIIREGRERSERAEREQRAYITEREKHYFLVMSRLDRMTEVAANLTDAARRPAAYPNATHVEYWHMQLKVLPDVGAMAAVHAVSEGLPGVGAIKAEPTVSQGLEGYNDRVTWDLKKLFESNEAAYKKYREGREGPLSYEELVLSKMWNLRMEVDAQCLGAYDLRHKH